MNSRKSLYDVKSFYNKKAVLKASYEGMRYQVEQISKEEDGEEEKYLKATVWPEPFCYEKTKDEKKEETFFPYTEEGLDQVYDWLCQKYDQEKDRWEHSRDYPLEEILEERKNS